MHEDGRQKRHRVAREAEQLWAEGHALRVPQAAEALE